MFAKSTKTPLLVFGTRHGTIFNLTPSNLPQLPCLQMCYGDFYDYTHTLENLPAQLPIRKFLGFPDEMMMYMAPYDHSKADCMTGCQNNSKVKIKCNKGYTEINAQDYDKMVKLLNPDIVVGLTEYPKLEKDHQKISNKSYKRAICKTKSYLEKSDLFNHKTQEKLPLLLAPIHGAKNLSLITRSLEQVLDHKIDGIIVCDLCEGESLKQREQIFEKINERLKQEYERQQSHLYQKKMKLALAGQGKIEDIEHAMKYGYEIFEVSYPFLLAEKLIALVPSEEGFVEHTPVKHENLLPLCKDCECHTCQNHAESYIAHLIQCKEMNAKVLLAIHNLHLYTEWMKKNCKEPLS